MLDFNSIRNVPRQLLNLLNTAIRNSVGMINAHNVEGDVIGQFQIVQFQSAGTRDVAASDTGGGPTKAAGPYGVSHSYMAIGARNGWIQAYGETWIQLSRGLNAAAVHGASAIWTSADPGHGDIVSDGITSRQVALVVDSSMYVGTTELNSQVRVLLLPLTMPIPGPP